MADLCYHTGTRQIACGHFLPSSPHLYRFCEKCPQLLKHGTGTEETVFPVHNCNESRFCLRAGGRFGTHLFFWLHQKNFAQTLARSVTVLSFGQHIHESKDRNFQNNVEMRGLVCTSHLKTQPWSCSYKVIWCMPGRPVAVNFVISGIARHPGVSVLFSRGFTCFLGTCWYESCWSGYLVHL